MKKKIYKLSTIVCLSLFFLGSTITAYASTDSEALVAEGRALLFNNGSPTTSGLLAANEEFKDAVSEDPADQEANFFYAVTRLPALVDDNASYAQGTPIENVKELLDGFGVDDDGRDIFNWTATVPEDAEGNIMLPSDTPSDPAIQEFLQSVIIYEIDEALANLAVIENPFEIILTATETGEDHDVEVDYGDVLLYKSLLYAAKAGILILCSYDLNVDIDVIVNKINNEIFNINTDLLDAYPDFLKLLADGGTIIGAAKTAILEAIDNYDAASIYIRETEEDGQWNDLFTIDPEEEAKEADFRSHLADIKDSITNQQPVDMGDEEEVFRVDFSKFFDDPISIRDYLPGFIHDPYIDEILINGISSFPDRTFSGIFPDGLPPEEYEIYIDKVVVWGGNSEGGQFSLILCYVNGLASWDIESLTVYGPDGFRYDFDIEHDISTHYKFGTMYMHQISGTLPEGWYHFVLKDKEGRDYHQEKHFTPNLINVVDMSAGASPADSAYVNTTTPTLSWASVTDETIGALYYRVNIMDWNKKVTIYTSDRAPGTTVTVPDGVLEPNTAYKWNVHVFDSQSGISANNLSSSPWNGFSTGNSVEPLSIEWASVSSRISPDNDQTQLGIKIIGPAPDDVGSITVTGPEGFSCSLSSSDLREDGAYKHNEDSILLDGAYTFTVVDGRDGITTETVDKEFNFNRLPIPEHLFSPLYQCYIETTIPTFSWSPVTASPVYYRIKIFDYSGKTVYKSDRSTATTATVPANILKPDNPYKWRVDVSDKETDPENCSTSWKWSFYVAKDNPAASISGLVDPNSTLTGYTSGGTIYVAVYDGPLPDGNLVAYVALFDAGQYALYNLPVGTDLYVYARWDADSDGSGSRTPGDWVGVYGINPITLTEGANPTDIDVQLNIELQAASVSGNILCDDFEPGLGDIYIAAYDGDDPSSDRLLDSTTITDISQTYTLSNLAVNGYVYLFARWDKDGSGTSSPADYTGSYAENPLVIQSSGNTGIDITVTNELAAAIGNGLQWLSQNQNQDGSWGDQYALAKTALAVLNFEKYAISRGYSSPLDPSYLYHAEVENGLNYIFANAYTTAIGVQPAGDPDGDGDGTGVYFNMPEDWYTTYYTSIAMMAIAASNAPDRVVDVPGSLVDGWTYQDVLQDVVDYLAWAQTDSGIGRGGWNYDATDSGGDRSDQSNSGWVTLALAYAEAESPEGFGLTVPDFVRTELDIWIDYIQDDVDGDDDDGGSHYSDITDPDDMGANMLRTGNLLQQMAFVGDTTSTQRVQDAIDYLVRHWNSGWNWNPSCYHTTYTVMKGLEALGISQIDSIDWFQDFSNALRSEQSIYGWWPVSSYDTGDSILSTDWAILTLQKAVAPTEENPDLVIINKYEEWLNETTGTYAVYYTVKNRGNVTAPAGYDVGLTIDGVDIEQQTVAEALSPGAIYSNSFTAVTLSGKRDEVAVCADINSEIDELNEDNNCTTSNWPPIIIGDVNDDGTVNLTDAILALQVMAGIEPTATVHKEADVNGDGKIGIEEVIYVFQKVSGLRE